MTPPATAPASPWTSYLDGFHERRPGITEDVLSEAADVEGNDPYAWLLDAAPRSPGGLALDVACGSSPLQSIASTCRWVGMDRSASELTRAVRRGPKVLVRGDGRALPFPDATFDLVACSMALMLFDPVDAVLAEIHRVLSDDGTALFLLPGSSPLTVRDRARYVRLLAALHEVRPAYPTSVHLGRLRARLERAGLAVVGDERRGFRYPLPDERRTRRFAESMYAPGHPPTHIEAAVRVATRWVGSSIDIPLRRVVGRKQVP